MKIVKPSFKIVGNINSLEMLQRMEVAGRLCYKSEDKITDTSYDKFLRGIIKKGHHTILEHDKVTVHIVCDRGVTHEIVRHRIASYSQESTRYCNYSNGKYGAEISIIDPIFFKDPNDPNAERKMEILIDTCKVIENAYMELIALGAAPQEARYILPTGTKTEIIMTCNLREWRHFFNLRALGTTGKPHPQMVEIAVPMLKEFKNQIPVIFDDLTIKED